MIKIKGMRYHNIFSITLLLSFVVIFSINSVSQEIGNKDRLMYRETIDDPWVPMLEKDIITTPAYKAGGSNYTTVQVNIDEEGNNILFDAANEPSIAVDWNNPARIIIGWRQFDNVVSNFRQAGYAYSEDYGETWVSPDPIDMGVFRSDPVLDIDNNGVFHYNSLTKDDQSNYWCDVFRTSPDEIVWDEGTFAQGGDKQWMTIDKTGGIGDGNIYAFWNSSFSICYPGSYTRSTDGGDTYEECDGVPGNPYWGTNSTGPDGELYLVGAASNTGVVVTKSSTAYNPDNVTTWDFATYVDLDGKLTGWTPVNEAGLLGQSYIDVDRSNGAGRGNVYVLASVQRNNGDPADVMFNRSTDGGATWEEPIRINDDPYGNKWQWFGTMSVAPNGRIDVVWLDTRNSPGTNIFISELYYSYSIDQGVTWSENERISDEFNPKLGYPNQNKMGDYFHMVSDNEGAHLAWANTFTGGQDVYYTRIIPWFVGTDDIEINREISLSVYPVPVRDKGSVSFELIENTEVSIEIIDILGNSSWIIEKQLYAAGTHNQIVNANELPAGLYFCRLTTNEGSKTVKFTVSHR